MVAIAMAIPDIMVRAYGVNNNDLHFSLVVCCSDVEVVATIAAELRWNTEVIMV